ncbi:MAG: hypothetical protein J6U60_02085 [Clostridia bacterium]|nr:hypothetical protein [Clostridia bacterium]
MQKIERFKLACVEYLETQTISTLRAYGRFLQMRDCTSMNKGELIREIVEVLSGERLEKRSTKGAPSKHNFVKPIVIEKIEELKELYFGEKGVPKRVQGKIREVPISGKVDSEGRIVILSEYLRRMGVRENEELSQRLYEDENGELFIVLRKIISG